MKKRVLAIAGATILVFSMATTALAAPYSRGGNRGRGNARYYSLMIDQDGYLLDKEAFEAKLDKAVEDSLIQTDDRDYYIEMYDYCSTYGGGFSGCCGRRW